MKNKLLIFISTILLISNFTSHSYAGEKFPKLDGKIFYQTQFDRIITSNQQNIPANNAFIYIEPNINLSFNNNWSIKTQWRLQPNDVLTTRNARYRNFLSKDRGFNFNEMGLLIEELKIQFQGDDIKVFAGKFDPTFGTVHRKSKRIGVFSSQFAEDYNLREKIGFGAVALLENSQINFNSFFNDNTDLSRSAINDRGRESKSDNIAGNTNTISSYSINMEGEDLFNIKNLFYNIGYRSLGVNKKYNNAREIGYVFGAEYLYKISKETSLIPLFEFVSIKNLSGIKNYNINYITLALIGNYRNWNTSFSAQYRGIESLKQFSVGYKFTNNLTLDLSRAEIFTQYRQKASLIGANINFVQKF